MLRRLNRTGFALCAIAALTLTGCGESGEPATTTSESQSGVVVDRYTVRGVIIALPDAANPASQLMVHHEHLPEFRGEKGARGMNEMTMPFPLATDLDLSSFSEGQKVRLTFTVDFDEANDRLMTYRATEIELLPAETGLNFGSADADTHDGE